MKKLRVLIIDDSAYNRQALADLLLRESEIEVVGKAADGEEGLKLASQLKPDLITLDIEMPRMDGFTFLRLLMHQMPTPVIVISSHSKKDEVFQALEMGALDFVAKPTGSGTVDLAAVGKELIAKVLMVRSLEPVVFAARSKNQPILATASEAGGPKSKSSSGVVLRLVCIGASTGGPTAVETILRGLGDIGPTAVMIAQHMPERFTRTFAERLSRTVGREVCEAEDRMIVRPGRVYVAPGGSHLEVVNDSTGAGVGVRILPADPTDRYLPSIDRLFSSAARLQAIEILSVILTGMGSDGSLGAAEVRAAGGVAIAESKETAVVFGMPNEAIRRGNVDEVLPLPAVAQRIARFGLEGLIK